MKNIVENKHNSIDLKKSNKDLKRKKSIKDNKNIKGKNSIKSSKVGTANHSVLRLALSSTVVKRAV